MTAPAFSPGRSYIERIRSVGWPILATIVASVLAIAALVLPVWSLEVNDGAGDTTKSTYTWTWLVEERFERGVWDRTTIISYTGPSFDQFRMREAVGIAYLVAVVLAVVLAVLAALQYFARVRHLPAGAITIVNIVALGLGFVAVAVPALTIQSAAASDVSNVVSGFFGSAAVGGSAYSWGAGASWWLWLVATMIALVLFVVPLARGRPRSRVGGPR